MATATSSTPKTRRIPQAGENWRHYEGSLCTVRDIARLPNRPDDLVVTYTCGGSPGQVFYRSLQGWMSEATPGVPRFTLEQVDKPRLSVVPPTREGILRQLIDGLDPIVLDVFRDVLRERHHQDEQHGRTGHSGRVWLHKLDQWKVKLSEALLIDDPELIRRRCVQCMAIGLAMLELGFEPHANEELPAPGVEFEEDETDDFGDGADDEGIRPVEDGDDLGGEG